MIYLTSDLHFNHDKPFVYEPRGFSTIQEMNETLVKNWNETVSENDIVYVLGDFFLDTDYDFIQKTIESLNGNIYLMLGNHDTNAKWEFYTRIPKILSVKYADIVVYKKRQFFMCHYPTLTTYEQSRPEKAIFNLFGHTHSTEKFFGDSPYMYNVAVDANDNRPVSIDDIYERIMEKVSKDIV